MPDKELSLPECGYTEADIETASPDDMNVYYSKDNQQKYGVVGIRIALLYTAAKGGISALTHGMAVSFAGKVRVNSISPGWIDNNYSVYKGADTVQQPVGRVGNPPDIANMVLYLCSDMAGFITGENICIDGGMTHQMIYHGDHGWKLEKN